LLVRLIAGKASDIYGRVPVLKMTIFLIIVSMVIVGLAGTSLMLMIGVSIYGLAQGATSPTLLAWATDLSSDEHRGRGIASLYISMEMGIGLGALLSGWVYGNLPSRFLFCFAIAAALSSIAFIYLLTKKRQPVVTLASDEIESL